MESNLIKFVDELYQLMFWFSIILNIKLSYLLIASLYERVKNGTEVLLNFSSKEKWAWLISIAVIISYLS